MRGHCGLMFALLIAACSGEDTGSSAPQAPAAGGAPNAAEQVACALGGAQSLATGCTLEQARVDGASYLVIRHPDGGFRRLAVLADGSIAEADGAERAVVSRSGDTIDVAVAQDRYRLTSQQVTNARQ